MRHSGDDVDDEDEDEEDEDDDADSDCGLIELLLLPSAPLASSGVVGGPALEAADMGPPSGVAGDPTRDLAPRPIVGVVSQLPTTRLAAPF